MLVPKPQELLNMGIFRVPDVQFYDICISPKFCVLLGVNEKSSSNEKRDVTDVKSMPNTFILLENAGNYYWKWIGETN